MLGSDIKNIVLYCIVFCNSMAKKKSNQKPYWKAKKVRACFYREKSSLVEGHPQSWATLDKRMFHTVLYEYLNRSELFISEITSWLVNLGDAGWKVARFEGWLTLTGGYLGWGEGVGAKFFQVKVKWICWPHLPRKSWDIIRACECCSLHVPWRTISILKGDLGCRPNAKTLILPNVSRSFWKYNVSVLT